jgi:hypothetical protein
LVVALILGAIELHLRGRRHGAFLLGALAGSRARGVAPRWGLRNLRLAERAVAGGRSAGTIRFGSDPAASFQGAGIAFAADAVVTVAVSLVTQKP